MPVHVSIHDVCPAFRPEVELALDRCHAAGIQPALLVVPDFHHGGPLDRDPPFAAFVRRLQAEGHEIFLHGFFHEVEPRRSSPRRSSGGLLGRARWLFAQRVVSAGEAEFSDVTRAEAEERLDEGERVLERAGLRIEGFVAPAWSMPSWLLPMLAARGVRYTEDHTRVYDPTAGRARPSVVLNYASRSPARLASTVAYCRVAKHARAFLPARIAIHPADMRYALLRSEIDHLISWARGDVVARGSELLG